MASLAFKYGAKKMMGGKGKSSKKSGDSETGPFHYDHVKTNGKGKVRRRKDCEYFMSCGIPEEDAKLLAKIKHRAMLMDGGGKVAGIPLPIGIGGAIGFIPVVGDAVDSALAYFLIVRSARKISGGLDSMAHKKMMANVTFDLAIGFVPVLGDIVDIFYRCNTRNANMLENILKKRVKELKIAEKGERVDGNHHASRYDGVTLDQAARLETASLSSSESPHSSTRRQHAPVESVKTKSRIWASGSEGQGSQKANVSSAEAASQRSIRPEIGHGASGPRGRYLNSRDIL